MEIIRFSLLIVLTLGLFSVAARAFDDDGPRPGVLGNGQSRTPPGSSATPGADPSGSPATSDGGQSTPADGSGGDGDEGSAGGGTGDVGSGSGGSGGGAIAAPELPRTGPDTAFRLTGIALVLIAGGGLSLAGARRRA